MPRRQRVADDDQPTFTGNFSKAIHHFLPSVGVTLPYMLFGIAIGLGLLYVARQLKHDSYWATFTEHVAAGLFVSAIAVLFYEWGSHVREAMALATKLEDFLSDPNHYVEHGLEKVLTKTDKALIVSQQEFITAIASLQANREWYAGGFVSFLGRFMRVAADNARNLESVSSDMLRHPGSVRPYKLNLPGPEVYADDMLTKQMDRLVENDTYDTFSNTETWLAPLETFEEAGFEAVKRGVTIRRMFIVPKAYSERDTVNLTRHFKAALASASGRYKVQIVDAAYTEEVLGLNPRPHYGIFRHANLAIVFNVDHPPAMGKFTILAGEIDDPSSSHRDDLHDKVSKFDAAWRRAASDYTFDVATFVDWALAREVDQLQTGGRYDVVTTIEANAGLEHARLSVGLRNAITRGVTVRRVIIIDPPDDTTHPVVQRYVTEANNIGQAYELRHVTSPATDDIEPCVVLSRDGGKRWHPVVFTEAGDETLSNFITEGSAGQHQSRFDRLWALAIPL